MERVGIGLDRTIKLNIYIFIFFFFQARVDNYWAPLTYTLLPNEDGKTIRTAFNQVRQAVESRGEMFTMGCDVMFDFDGNLRDAYKEVIGNDYKHVCRGCSFHFGQCICNM